MKISSNIFDIIQELCVLNLSNYPSEEIISLLRQVSNLPVLITTLHPGRRILRGRTYNEGEDFTSIASHSYNPYPSKKFQRANVPGQSIFYGSVTSDVEEEPIARFTILAEIGDTLTDKVKEEKIMYSVWEVIEDISLFSIIQSTHYETPNKLILELETQFNDKFKDVDTRIFLDFIASEFAKSDTSEDYNYLISALFSSCVYEQLDGIYYPSVRTAGAGMNVAILPEVVNTKMIFLGALDCEVVRNDSNIEIIEKRKAVINLEYVPITSEDFKW